MQVSRWGNSLAIRLPASVVEVLGLKEGDDIDIQVASARGFHIAKKPDDAAMLARLRQHRGKLPADFHFDRVDANTR